MLAAENAVPIALECVAKDDVSRALLAIPRCVCDE